MTVMNGDLDETDKTSHGITYAYIVYLLIYLFMSVFISSLFIHMFSCVLGLFACTVIKSLLY